MSIELSKAKEQAKSLEQQCSVLQQNNQNQADLHSRIEELNNDKGSLEQRLNEVNSQLKSSDDALAASKSELEAKLSEWEEEKAALAASVNQVSFNGQASQEEQEKKEEELQKKEEEFVEKFNVVLKEKEALVQKISNDQEQIQNKSSEADNLRNEMETLKVQLKEATVSLDQQRAKNDDEKSSVIKETEDKYISFLSRVFADVDFKADESQWKDCVEAQMKALKEPPPPPPPAEDTSSNEEIEKLEKQVNHYKSSLQETESLLHNLQASVEAEEAKWKQSLSDQQKELEALKEQNAKMESCVQSAEEMQEKLQQLQSQLIGHEAAKRDLEKTLAEKNDCESEEKQKLIQEIESLKEGKSELGLQVARMNQLVTAGQEALQQEQKTADLLREQLAKVKDSSETNAAENSTTNNEVIASST